MNKQNWQTYLGILIRVLIALMFVESAIDKIVHWDVYVNEINAKGLPLPTIALTFAILVEAIGSLALLTGILLPFGAFLLAGYVFVINFLYFDFWNQTGMSSVMSRKEFLKDLAVVAGLLQLAFMHSKNILLRIKSSTFKSKSKHQSMSA